MVPPYVLQAFAIDGSAHVEPYGSGHIHKTYKVSHAQKNFILQRINHYVFKNPELIFNNLQVAGDYLATHYPNYLFLSAIQSTHGNERVVDEQGYSWRMFHFIENTTTIDEVNRVEEAYEAARGFAELSKNLSQCDPNKFSATIDRFHDLSLRYEQFEAALQDASDERIQLAKPAIQKGKAFEYLVDQYHQLISSGNLKLRITHNDTKINNILFDIDTRKAVCVIDLDTLMPGYFIYDLGDMVRTFVSPSGESDPDQSKIVFRKEIYSALVDGYLSEMKAVLTKEELASIPFAGLMMTYMIGLRFLTDFLNGDVYFSTSHPMQNLDRAKNQLKLLEVISKELT